LKETITAAINMKKIKGTLLAAATTQILQMLSLQLPSSLTSKVLLTYRIISLKRL